MDVLGGYCGGRGERYRAVFVISTAVILNGGYNYTNANVYTQYIYSKIERLDTALFLGFMAWS